MPPPRDRRGPGDTAGVVAHGAAVHPGRRRLITAAALSGALPGALAGTLSGALPAALSAAFVGLAARPARAAEPRPRRPRRDDPAPRYAGHPAVAAFAAELAARHGWDEAALRAELGRGRRVESVRRLIMPPPTGTARDWTAYRARFIEPQRVAAGVMFWREHARWLAEAERRWQVPAALVVAIIGVETFYGRVMGTHRVLDALCTLAFDFPPGRRDRSAFFRDELEQYLLWSRREGLAPGATRGSFAGAIGLPQFMPGSINRWAVDLDGDGHVDLVGNPADAVGSVANFLAEHGWQPGLPTHHAVSPPEDTAARATLLAPDIRPTFSAGAMRALGAGLPAALPDDTGPLALVELDNGALPPSHVAGTANFFVVTRYNRSAYYALAVIELAEALERARPERG